MRVAIRACLLCLTALSLAAPAHACRFWGVVGVGYPENLIADHLRDGTTNNLVRLSGTYRNGWGIAYFLPDDVPLPLTRPVIRRGGAPPNHPSAVEFDLAVEELTAIRPKAALAHIRRCSSGPCGIPDPHPLQHDGKLFAHNGTISDSLLTALLTADDPRYLADHPPEYTGIPIDSELFLFYLLKTIDQHPELSEPEALQRALSDLASLTGSRLNFVLTAGDGLYAARCATNDENDPVRYYPADGTPSPWWVVASQILGSYPDDWAAIPPRTLALFIPGQIPQFFPIEGDTTSTTGLADARWAAVGAVAPNPARTGVAILLLGAREGMSATIEVWDAQGRLLWREGPRPLGLGEREVRWDTRDLAGREVRSGIYFCRVSVGQERRVQSISVLR
jgi:predicted glutamine amidotransferase